MISSGELSPIEGIKKEKKIQEESLIFFIFYKQKLWEVEEPVCCRTRFARSRDFPALRASPQSLKREYAARTPRRQHHYLGMMFTLILFALFPLLSIKIKS